MSEEERDLMTRAFPRALHESAASALSKVSFRTQHPASLFFFPKVAGEIVTIPQRVYFDNLADVEAASLNGLERTIIDLLCTRHENGFVRERSLANVIGLREAWVAPFVIRLLGEYVVEILTLIERRRDELDPAIYADFLVHNARFFEATRSRVVSYWDCYYRSDCPKFRCYVGSRLIDFFDGLVAKP